MSLAPLLDASPAILMHAIAALVALVLGIVQLVAPKGSLPHRAIGYVWAALMVTIALTSFWIHEIRLLGPFSPIHLLSVLTLATVPLAIWAAHRYRVRAHRIAMLMLFFAALVGAGAFTLLPGRIMGAVVYGG